MSATTEANWGVTLRDRRQSLGWSLAELGKRTGLSRAYLSALERGKSKRPGVDAIRRLEDVLGPLWSRPVDSAHDLPLGLAEFAAENRIAPSEVSALASLRVRGRPPRSKERWAFIYQALLASEYMDNAELSYRKTKSRDS